MGLYPEYAELDDLKRHLRIPGNYEGTLSTDEDSTDDLVLEMAISSASRIIDNATNRQFGLSDSTISMVYTPEYDPTLCRYYVNIFDVMTASGLVVNFDSDDDGDYETAVTTYRLLPFNNAAKSKPWTQIVFDTGTVVPTELGSCEVVAKYGWSAVPTTIKKATLIQAARIVKRRDAPFGVAGSPEMGNELRLLSKIDPDVQVLVNPYKRWWG
jgi:hypothetical protein